MNMLSEHNPFDGMTIAELAAFAESQQNKVELLEDRLNEISTTGAVPLSEASNIAQLQLAVDDIGWNPLNGWGDDGTTEMPLQTIQKISKLARALVTANPLIKRGVAIRAGYIWGQGVDIAMDGNTRGRPSSTKPVLPDTVKSALGTSLAQLELERTAAADGNMFFLCDPGKKTVVRVPIQQISGKVTEAGNRENILYFKRSWMDREVDLGTGVPLGDKEPTERWYASSTYKGRVTSSIGDVEVDRNLRIVHVPFNRMTGQSWGIPDIFAVVWWVRAYKEYLENCATLSKAQAQFAWKITSASGKGQARVASSMAAPPARDPATGQSLNIGGAVALGAGQDLQAINRTANVDYSGGSALAALVAAGLEVPLPALTSDPGTGNRATAETLDDPTKLAMLARQRMMADAFEEVFRVLYIRAHVEWPEIAPDMQHRRVQAADMAIRTGSFDRNESRSIMKVALGKNWAELPDEAPEEDQLPYVVKTATAGVAQVDPPSRGDHTLRDQGSQAHTEE